MTHGPDTNLLLWKVAECRDKLDVSRLNITSLPELPAGLKMLDCHDTQLTSLPKLPDSLERLECDHTQLTSLPKLPDSLEDLQCEHTQLTSLPKLPTGLRRLFCHSTPLTTLPELPAGLRALCCVDTPLVLQRSKGESIADYNLRWREWREEQASKQRIQSKHRLLKEEIVMEAWHPRKVERWLELGAELEDM